MTNRNIYKEDKVSNNMKKENSNKKTGKKDGQ